jgi:hypothetical protein
VTHFNNENAFFVVLCRRGSFFLFKKLSTQLETRNSVLAQARFAIFPLARVHVHSEVLKGKILYKYEKLGREFSPGFDGSFSQAWQAEEKYHNGRMNFKMKKYAGSNRIRFFLPFPLRQCNKTFCKRKKTKGDTKSVLRIKCTQRQ